MWLIFVKSGRFSSLARIVSAKKVISRFRGTGGAWREDERDWRVFECDSRFENIQQARNFEKRILLWKPSI